MKIVLNKDFGGFSISKEAAEFMAARGNEQAKREIEEQTAHPDRRWFGYGYVEGMEDGYDRTDPDLIAAIETLGEKANGSCACLKVIEIPDGIDYEIEEYDGLESIHEKHRSWG